ncbi:MAG: aspartate--tRNA(Asn) ligase [Nanoarchaeota archaeon]|nr:aspartate--tRNA(Asn) ligase [Nanoarchaeota archaeon]MBU1135036.1 aspartate--tRNA(Asn) ligase [Nanoarchaeota archaeon]MBU2520322.1 aspartate--tRNA(Asn) ligase [Nanoarchaeota archaeon]
MIRTYSHEIKPGKVLAMGWVENIRIMGSLAFITLRDREGLMQVTLKKGDVPDEYFELVSNMNKEDCISVHGDAKKSSHSRLGIEIYPEKIEIVSKAETPLPIDTGAVKHTLKDKRFDYRFLDMRDPKIQAIFRIRDVIFTKMREYFENNRFIEIHTPVIQAAGAEGGATLFGFNYYQHKAFLRQSPQLYKQIMMASGLDRVYEIGPAFRAEKFHTRRHVSEFISVDFEQAWIESEEDVMKTLEEMVHHVYKGVKKDCKTALDILEIDPEIPKLPFKRFTYDEVLEALAKSGTKIKWGSDLEDADEKKFGEIAKKKGHEWYFIIKYPAEMKPFYIMAEQDGKYSRGFDLDCKGMELASGGQREHRVNKLVERMKAAELNSKDFNFYIDAFKYGMPPHAGIGLGGDRLVQQIVGMENIKETILFPRTPEKVTP